ncbi:Stub1 protein [Paraphysoderma sedebokerense]|nr:Stub1 protein [Paraphysoderma sedebokerense]
MDAEQHKNRGNNFFSDQDYESAIGEYTKAIIKNPNNSVYFTNRAVCYRKLEKWEEVVNDARKKHSATAFQTYFPGHETKLNKLFALIPFPSFGVQAIEIDELSVKGYYFYGLALTELKRRLPEAVENLQKGYRLSLSSTKKTDITISDEIRQTLIKAQKLRWQKDRSKMIEEKHELANYLRNLIDADRARQLNSATTDVETEDINWHLDERLSQVTQVFTQLDDLMYGKQEVPDCLLDKISFELIQDPVITPNGITYDRREILRHLKSVGEFDPFTREPLKEKDLIPNLLMKEVIDNFLKDNGWAAE